MNEPEILFECEGPLATVTLNRPAALNALTWAMYDGLVAACERVDADDGIRVMIVRGAGKCWSAGYELGGGNEGLELPFYTPGGDGQWPRHVTERDRKSVV